MTHTPHSMYDPLRNQRGQGLALMGIGLVAFLGLAVVAIDVGRLAYTATEVQAVAESAALEAAKIWVRSNFTDNGCSAAQTVSGANKVDGTAYSTLACGDLAYGYYDVSTYQFPVGQGTNTAPAVKATARRTVTNIGASMIGRPSDQVEKTAIAGWATLGSATPTLPLAVGYCPPQTFQQGCVSADCLPTITLITGTNNAAWTSFSLGANTGNIESYMGSCAQGGSCRACGSSSAPPELTVNDSINLMNGMNNSILNDLYCNVCSTGQNTFIVPVVNGCGFNGQSASVVGFVTIQVNGFADNHGNTYACGQNPNGVVSANLQAVTNDHITGKPGGCSGCGSGFVVLIG